MTIKKMSVFKKFKRTISYALFSLKTKFYKKDNRPKVICIGFNKTGTTSIGKSLKEMGFKHCTFHPKLWKLYLDGEFSQLVEMSKKFESFDDLPWLKENMIELLDQSFPGSKFIYLERDEESWKKSFHDWSIKLFGKPKNVEIEWRTYCEHRDFVTNYFIERPEDLLSLNIKDQNGYKKMCKFIGKPLLRESFPHFNKT